MVNPLLFFHFNYLMGEKSSPLDCDTIVVKRISGESLKEAKSPLKIHGSGTRDIVLAIL